MKAKPLRFVAGSGYEPCASEEATHIELNMPGPFAFRMIPVIRSGPRVGTGNWTWNGGVESPTLRPSIRTTNGEGGQVCHCWVTGGWVQFLDDCTHSLRGQTVELLEVE